MKPFPLRLCLFIPLAHLSTCMGSLFIPSALLRGLCWPKKRNASVLSVCICFTLLCNNSYWGVFAEGNKWCKAACSNKINVCILSLWSFCVWVIVRTCCRCTYLFKSLHPDIWTPFWPCTHANICLFYSCHVSFAHLCLASPTMLKRASTHSIHTQTYTTF